MYEYDYEGDVLGTLSVLKLLKERQPARFESIRKNFKTLEWQYMEELAWEATWELFDSADNDFVPDYETDVWTIRDKAIDQFWINIQKRARASSSYSDMACRELVRDTIAYFLGASSYTIGQMECYMHGGSVSVKMWLSPDIYEPTLFGADVVTLLRYLQAENDKIAARTKKRKSKKAKNIEKEAA